MMMIFFAANIVKNTLSNKENDKKSLIFNGILVQKHTGQIAATPLHCYIWKTRWWLRVEIE
jgi:hypothetical protein